MNDTPCKNCCFAVYNDITQVDCARDRLDKYRSAGTTVIEAYDEDKEFYVIKNRICPFYRDKTWLDQLSGKTDAEVEKILRFETMSSFHLIILLKEDSTLEDLRKTVHSIQFEFVNVPPAQVTIIKPRKLIIRPADIKELFTGIPVKWRIENLIVDKSHSDIIHSTQKTVRSQYYCVCKAGWELPKNYFKIVDRAIMDNLLQFGMIEVEDGQLDGIIIPVHVHQYWYFHGNVEKTIPENIKEYQCQNQEQQVVIQLQQIKNMNLLSA